MARGNVGLNIYLYPGAAPSPDGTRQDGRVTQNLSNDFHTYSYELTTFGSFSGDPNKQLLFRFPSDSNGGFVEIYPSSIRVKKVGGVAKAPSRPQAAGLLYSGSFTVTLTPRPRNWGRYITI